MPFSIGAKRDVSHANDGSDGGAPENAYRPNILLYFNVRMLSSIGLLPTAFVLIYSVIRHCYSRSLVGLLIAAIAVIRIMVHSNILSVVEHFQVKL